MAEDRLGGQLSIVSAVLAAAPLALLIGYAAISIKNGEGGRSGESAGP